MIFKTDKQTVDDLALFRTRRGKSVYDIFNRTATAGGALLLEQMFYYPLSNRLEIEHRSRTIRFFTEYLVEFPFEGALLDAIEFYLSNSDKRTRISAHEENLERKFKIILGSDSDYEQIKKGVMCTVQFICRLKGFVQWMISIGFEGKSGYGLSELRNSVTDPVFEEVYAVDGSRNLSFEQTVRLDQLLRFSCREKIKVLLGEAYKFDLFIAVAEVSREQGFCFAQLCNDKIDRKGKGSETTMLEIVDGFHPLVEGAVPNSVRIDSDNNMIFLTGANMAGKSTFMKMVGITVYLAHMGFPVPASRMRFRLLNGMFTTINLADNINAGYSHFYAEVMRVKRVSEKVGEEGNMLVIFDELFRGTNVKDACDATIAVTDALAGIRNSIFVISSHIIEAGEILGALRENIGFLNLPTRMRGKIPEYTYKIEKGISRDRHGMLIIKNEGILQLLGYNFE